MSNMDVVLNHYYSVSLQLQIVGNPTDDVGENINMMSKNETKTSMTRFVQSYRPMYGLWPLYTIEREVITHSPIGVPSFPRSVIRRPAIETTNGKKTLVNNNYYNMYPLAL